MNVEKFKNLIRNSKCLRRLVEARRRYIVRTFEKNEKKFFMESAEMVYDHNDKKAVVDVIMNANRYRVLEYYGGKQLEKYRKYIEYLKNNMPKEMQPCHEKDSYILSKEGIYVSESIKYDYEEGKYYSDYYKCKMYFPTSYDKAKAISYMTTLAFEQTDASAHQYLNEDFKLENDTVLFDLGAAEGFFVLANIEQIKEAYLFECDEEWLEALKVTFKDMPNIHIVDKFVSDEDNDRNIMLDSFIESQNIDLGVASIFVKMDIEGSETKAIKGGSRMLSVTPKLKAAICTYHGEDEYENITSLLEKFNRFEIHKSNGYMLPLWGRKKPPFFLVGVVRVKNINDEHKRNRK